MPASRLAVSEHRLLAQSQELGLHRINRSNLYKKIKEDALKR
jgi:hypothetical protein